MTNVTPNGSPLARALGGRMEAVFERVGKLLGAEVSGLGNLPRVGRSWSPITPSTGTSPSRRG